MNIEHKFKELHELLLCAYDEDYEESLDRALKELDELKKEIVKKLTIPDVSHISYSSEFLKWRNRFFEYKPKTYEYRTKDGKKEYTITQLHKYYEKAMLESPFNCG